MNHAGKNTNVLLSKRKRSIHATRHGIRITKRSKINRKTLKKKTERLTEIRIVGVRPPSITFFKSLSFDDINEIMKEVGVAKPISSVIYGYAKWSCRYCGSHERGMVAKCPCGRENCTCKEDICGICYFHMQRGSCYGPYYDVCQCSLCIGSVQKLIRCQNGCSLWSFAHMGPRTKTGQPYDTGFRLRFRQNVFRCTMPGCNETAQCWKFNQLPEFCYAHATTDDYVQSFEGVCAKPGCDFRSITKAEDIMDFYNGPEVFCYLHYVAT